jgi:hypothetical protein
MLNVGEDNFTTLCFFQLSKGFCGCKLGDILVKKGETECDSKGKDQRKKKYTAEIQN